MNVKEKKCNLNVEVQYKENLGSRINQRSFFHNKRKGRFEELSSDVIREKIKKRTIKNYMNRYLRCEPYEYLIFSSSEAFLRRFLTISFCITFVDISLRSYLFLIGSEKSYLSK